jgi:hypothetical protein
VLLLSCESPQQKSERLAKKYCSSCHVFPEPTLLDKKSWEKGVLPQMAFRMGIEFSLLQSFSENDMKEVLKTLPQKPMVTDEEWKSIQAYYLQNAPDSLQQNPDTNVTAALDGFKVIPYRFPFRTDPLTCLVKYDSVGKNIFLGTRRSKLYKLTAGLVLSDSFDLPSPPSDILFLSDNEVIISCMGIMDPNDQPAGTIVQLNTAVRSQSTLIDSIKRPVEIQMADLNNDGKKDFVIAAFGNFTGGLIICEKTDSGFEQHLVHALPGTRKTIVQDFNNDGLNDILTLVTQGDEQVMLLINEGKFRFRPTVLLRFSPVFGSSYFDIADFNRDGHFDILYTNGDNMDYSSILKPYHGVRVFLNNGKNQFNEHWFYPMHGASKALARDFDKDGDLDIAAISFFPDFETHPEQGFLYFNNNNGSFSPAASPLGAAGRWLVMEAADLDTDGDADLILGALNFQATVPLKLRSQWQSSPTNLLILKPTLN